MGELVSCNLPAGEPVPFSENGPSKFEMAVAGISLWDQEDRSAEGLEEQD
jgi:hypothetical protein